MKRFVPFIAAGVALLAILVWYAAIYSPKNHDLSTAHAEQQAAESQRASLQAQLSNLRGLQANRAKQQAALQKLTAAVPTTPDLAGFILQANDIATQAGVDWLQVSPTLPTAAAGGGPTTINVTMQLEGGFFQVYDYLNRLEDLQRLVIVDTINLTAKSGDTTTGGSSSDPTLSMSLTARMFTRAAPATGTTGATSGGTGSTATTPTTVASSGTTPNTRVG